MWHNYNFYGWQDGSWVAHDTAQDLEQFINLYPDRPYLRGFTVSDEQFWGIYHQAFDDPRLPARTGCPPKERPLPERYRYWAFGEYDDVK
jgi:hypothetical protein